MFGAALRRIKVRALKAVLGRKTAKTAARLLAGNEGVEVFNRAFDFIQSMVGNSKEADKLIDKSFKILSEFSILYADKTITDVDLESMRERFEKICARMEQFYKLQPELVDNKLDITSEGGKKGQAMIEDIVTECTTIIIDTVGHHFQPSAVRKFKEIAEKMRHPNIVAELVWVKSPTNTILNDLIVKADRVMETISKYPEGGEPWGERIATSCEILLLGEEGQGEDQNEDGQA